MSRVAYYRVSTDGQSIEAQRHALGGEFAREFSDEGVSGAVLAAERPGFGEALRYLRDGDTLCVAALDRLGRDALDVQATVRRLLNEGVTLDVKGLGPIGRGVGELIVAVLAQLADIERARIKERCDAGRDVARAALAATGKTHRGAAGLGRQIAVHKQGISPADVAAWRRENGATISQTMARFGISKATVARYCAGSAG
jgi:putative DNA-invertase from lambdoid prophage Rac